MKNLTSDPNKNLKQKNATIKRVKKFLCVSDFDFKGETIQENIREIACDKLCKVIGINGKCNLKNQFFSFFSLVMGEAISQNLKLSLNIAPPELKFVKYDGVNFVSAVSENLKKSSIDEAFLDTFMLIDDNRHVVESFFNWQKY